MVVMLELLLVAALCISTNQLSPNIVTEEVKTRVVKTKYGKVQGFVSKVNVGMLKCSGINTSPILSHRVRDLENWRRDTGIFWYQDFFGARIFWCTWYTRIFFGTGISWQQA